jgi:DNA-3-methyladenine glycosylase I
MTTDQGDYYTAEGYYVPPRRKPDADSGYLEMMAQAIFQAGFSWEVVRRKWPDFRIAFDGFSVDSVAAYGPDDLDRLVADRKIIRNARKIEAVIENARIMRGLIREHGSFYAYLRSLDNLPYHKRRNVLTRQFRWLGRTGVFVMLWCVGEEVPEWADR